MHRSPYVSVLCSLMLLMSVTISAQTFRGTISGNVSDQSGAAMPGALVTLTSEGTGLTRSQETTNTGDFIFSDLPVGFYKISITKAGFQTQKLEKVEVAAGKITNLTQSLNIGQTEETITVQSAAVSLETSTSTINAVVNSRAVQEIPLNGRDFRQLLFLTPGYNLAGSMNGNRTNQNNWQIDGTDNNDFWHNQEAVNQGSISGIAGVMLPLDSIDQFNQQAAGNGEFGRSPGSQVNMALKSGTNQFHGSAYYFNRNEAFAEPPPFVPAGKTNKLRNEHLGFSLGGPILKNRTFFFINYEKQNYVIADPNSGTVLSDAWIEEGKKALAAKGVAVNPAMLNTYLNLWPSRSRTAPASTTNFISGDENTGVSNNGVIKIDQQIGAKHTLSARAFLGTGEAAQYAGSVYREYYQLVPSRQHNFAVIWNSTWTPRLVNQLLFGLNYFNQTFDDASHSANPPSWGFNTGVTNPENFGSPTINLTGFDRGGVGMTARLGRVDVTGHLTNNLSYNFSNHSMKFGGEFRRAKLDVFYYREARGEFTFTGDQGNWDVNPLGLKFTSAAKSVADFLAGYVKKGNAAIATGDPQRDYYMNSFESWAQDHWQITPNLNINYGVRYTYHGRLHAVGDKSIGIFDPSVPSGIATIGKERDALYDADYNNFAPRFGFAYSPSRDSKLVFRGHYGIYYDLVSGNLFIDNRAGADAGRGVSRQPVGTAKVFSISNPGLVKGVSGDYDVIQSGKYIFGDAASPSSFALYTVNRNLRTPYVQNFGFDVQYEISRNAMLTLGYVGNLGRKLVYSRNINQMTPSAVGQSDTRRPFYGQFPAFRGITEIETAAVSHYHAMQVSLRTSTWRNISSQFSYTWGHAIDEISAPRNTQTANSYDRSFNRGNADFDFRHVFSAYVLYDLPRFTEALPLLTQGWQVNMFMTADSGSPFTIVSGKDSDPTSSSNTRNGADRVDQTGDPFSGITQPAVVDGRYTNGIRYFNAGAFKAPAPGSYGTIGRNSFHGPGFASVGFSIFKNFKIKERYSLQLRSEIFNLFNRLNMANPGNSFAAGANFGVIRGTRTGGNAPGIGFGEPRNIQLAAKFTF